MKIITKIYNEVFTLLIILVLSILSILACGPKPVMVIKPNVPYNLKATTKSKGAALCWNINRDDKTPISGYNIYLADTPENEGELYNSGPYPGDTDGDIARESIELLRLTNGKKYYAYIRTVFAGGRMSEPSARVMFRPLAQGRLEISQNHTTKQSGFSFAKNKLTAARDFDNDFYIYATAEKSGISSPSRLHSSLRKTMIKIGGFNSKDIFRQTKPLIKGRIYILKLTGGGQAKLTLVKFARQQPNLTAVFDYIYYPPGINP
ncbi:MAG: fibronectin type III domain-containing protein [candidate division Zixibacteria bacterium]|nr:fibronectin type III domain-containing protein [candidate division Zixibacteria bacterium]